MGGREIHHKPAEEEEEGKSRKIGEEEEQPGRRESRLVGKGQSSRLT